jgi:hypothetical protein
LITNVVRTVIDTVHEAIDQENTQATLFSGFNILIQIRVFHTGEVELAARIKNADFEIAGLDPYIDLYVAIDRFIGVLDDVRAGFVDGQLCIIRFTWGEPCLFADLCHEVPNMTQLSLFSGNRQLSDL